MFQNKIAQGASKTQEKQTHTPVFTLLSFKTAAQSIFRTIFYF